MKRLLAALTAFVALAVAAPAMAQTTGTVDVTVYNSLGWTCNGPVDIDLLRVRAPATQPNGTASQNGNAVTFDPGCTGTIDRIEITTSMADGIKIRNNAVNNAHDLTINGGFIRGIAHAPGAHADCVQGMGGDRITMNNILCDYRNRPGGGAWYIGIGGAGTGGPSVDVVCNNCHFIHGATSVRMDSPSVRSGIRNSVVCNPQGAAEAAAAVWTTEAQNAVGVSRTPVTIRDGQNEDAWTDGNIAVPSSDPRCSTEPSGSPPPVDTDGDGVPDASDACPTEPGPASNGGCPVLPPADADDDGVPDANDLCPTEPGPASNGGCPIPPPADADGDGVPDADDNCMNVANAGQEDSDADGAGNACDTATWAQYDALAALVAQRTAERDAAAAARDACRSKLTRINTRFHGSGTNATKLGTIHSIIHEAGLCAGFTP